MADDYNYSYNSTVFNGNDADYASYNGGGDYNGYNSGANSYSGDNGGYSVYSSGNSNQQAQSTGHSSGANVFGYIMKGFSSAAEGYGIWYEGQQQYLSLHLQADLTMREKQLARRQIEIDERQAEFMQMQADYAKDDAAIVKKTGEILLKDFQDATDEGMAAGYAKTARTGVDMSFGSPLDVLADNADKRAYGYVVSKWKADTETWRAEREAQGIQEKATIMLDKTKVDRENLKMYDFQKKLFLNAARETVHAAKWRRIGAAFSNAAG